jgi:hypothetical protein
MNRSYDLYLSYPMTLVTPLDLDARDQLRNACERRLLDVYDPATMEPPGKSIACYRSLDFFKLERCRGMIVCWSDMANCSKGVAAEIEWAATRCKRTSVMEGLDLPMGVWVWRNSSVESPEIHPWIRAAMQVAFNRWGGGIYTGGRGLRKIMERIC